MPVAPVKVSVVVPVYNPGTHIEPLIESLRRQSMSTDEFEAVFVDDGSTDSTPARLDALAETTWNMRVVHQPNSGWPGKPRNVGIEMARGEFVQFVDQDDELGPEALERLYQRATETSSDMVLGKVVGRGRSVPVSVYRKRDDHATLEHSPLISTLSPHKLFRRQMLDEHHIRFPEGRRRLEDHPFVLQCYFKARNIAILADYPCYYFNRREDKENNSFQTFDPAGYFNNVEDSVDVVEANTKPGPLRNRLLSRFYRNEMLGWLREPGILRLPEDYRKDLFEQAGQLATRRFPAAVHDHLPLPNRLRSILLREGRLDDMVEFARRCDDVRAYAELRAARWNDGRLELDVEATMGYHDGTRVTWVQDGERLRFDPRLTDGLFGDDERELDSAKRVLGQMTADVTVRSRETGAEWSVPSELTKRLVPVDENGSVTSTATGVAVVDPERLLGGATLTAGHWDFFVHLSFGGLVRKARIGIATPERAPLVAAVVGGDPKMRVKPYFTAGHDKLSVHVRPVASDKQGKRKPPPQRRNATARKAMHKLGGAADATLRALPISPDRAATYSRRLRRAGRVIVGSRPSGRGRPAGQDAITRRKGPTMAKTSQAHAVDEVHSWARRSGDRVHIVLRLPGVDLERGAEPTIELKRGGTMASATATVTDTTGGTTLTADAPAADLGTGTWRLTLRVPGEDAQRKIDARLLLPRRGPIALLTGPVPERALQPRPRGGSLAKRTVRAVGTATDAVLRELPPDRAVRYRVALRRVARTVRG